MHVFFVGLDKGNVSLGCETVATVTEQPKEGTVVSYRVGMQADVPAAPFFSMCTSLKHYFVRCCVSQEITKVQGVVTHHCLVFTHLVPHFFAFFVAVRNP